MNYFHAYSPRFDIAKGLPELQRTILKRIHAGTVTYNDYGGPSLSAPLAEISNAVESAYILTAKADLPKVTKVSDLSGRGLGLAYYFDGSEDRVRAISSTTSAEYARKVAAEWLAVAAHLEREEKAKAAEEAKAKAAAEAAEKAAEAARGRRLDELADEWFGEDYFSDLAPNKAAAVKEIYRLETTLEERDCA